MTDTSSSRKKRKFNQYGQHDITVDEFELILLVQERKCCICKADFRVTKPFLDHNHKTGVIRGALCHHCNSGIGFFRDNVNFLNSAIEYLLHHDKCPRPPTSLTAKLPGSRFYEAMQRIENEDVLPLTQCTHLFPKQVSYSAALGYVMNGVRCKLTGERVYLEAFRGVRWVTSKQAVRRFIERKAGKDVE